MNAYEHHGYHRLAKASACRSPMRRIAAIAAAAILIARASHGADAARDALLDEIGAAVDANLALIQCGVAKYREVETTYDRPPLAASVRLGSKPHEEPPHDGKPHGPYSSETVVYFDYPRVRFDWSGQRRTTAGDVIETSDRTIFDGQYRIFTSSGASAFARVEPSERGYVPSGAIHPRKQASRNSGSYFDSALIAKLRNNSVTKLLVIPEPGGYVRLTMEGPFGRMSHWLSPNEAYSAVRAKFWGSGEDESAEPYQVHEATFRKASNGAFVLEHRVSHEMLDGPDGKLTPSLDEEVTLLDIQMRDSLDPRLFTLDGLELPAGARIIDTLRGRTYQYEIPAVAESGIIPPEPRGAVAAWRWLTPAYVLVGAALAGALVWRIRRAGAPRRRGNAPTNDP